MARTCRQSAQFYLKSLTRKAKLERSYDENIKMRAYILLTNYRESHHRGSDKVDFPNLLEDFLIDGLFKFSIIFVMGIFEPDPDTFGILYSQIVC